MKKIFGFIFDVILIAIAFGVTDIIMYKLGSDEWWLDLVIFIGVSLVLEVIKLMFVKNFSRK